MKVRLIKKCSPHLRELPKGSIMKVSKDFGAELIEKGFAEDIEKVKINTKSKPKFVKDESKSNK